MFEIDEKPFMLGLHLEDTQVEEQVETLIYDLGNFLAQAGGNVSLILGWSMFSLYFSMMKLLREHFSISQY